MEELEPPFDVMALFREADSIILAALETGVPEHTAAAPAAVFLLSTLLWVSFLHPEYFALW